MSVSVVFRRVARIEFDEAADWYERQQAGLGPRFVASVQRALDRIAAKPDSFPVVLSTVREALVQRFPYCIYYIQESEQVLVQKPLNHWSRPSGVVIHDSDPPQSQ